MGSIIVSNLGKAYKKYPNRWARLWEWLDPETKPRHQLHWVLQDINFSINLGESVGIIGINGAGKSTLLKMITGTTKPTTGSIQIQGRVAALLELGMGFHPDFTGRQNTYMAGQLLGYSSEEITRLMPEIEAFAEIGEYIDQPVRVYSSGMQMRLAFAVATAQRPDILIIDEALSVGDASFQRKCFRLIESYRTNGTTLLFVSHDIETIKKICDRAIFINSGHLAYYDIAKKVCDIYEKFLFGGNKDRINQENSLRTINTVPHTSRYDPSLTSNCEVIYGNGKANIDKCWIEDTNKNKINVIESGSPFRWCYNVKFNEDVEKPIFAMMIKTREGISLYGTDSISIKINNNKALAGDCFDVVFTLSNTLAPGIYYLNCGIRDEITGKMEFLSRRVDSAILKVIATPRTTIASGLVEMNANLELIQSTTKDE